MTDRMHDARTGRLVGDLYRARLEEGSAIPCGMWIQSDRISENDHGDYQWITRHEMANWGSVRALVAFRVRTFGGAVAGLHPHHVY